MYVEHVHAHALGDGLYGMRVQGRWVRLGYGQAKEK